MKNSKSYIQIVGVLTSIVVVLFAFLLFHLMTTKSPLQGIIHSQAASPGDWREYGFGQSGGRYNPSETTISTSNVQNLVQFWSFTDPEQMDGAPVEAAGRVYFGGSQDHTIYSLDANTGALDWSYRTGQFFSSDSSSAVVGGVVYTSSNDGRLYALDAATGAQKWVRLLGGGIGDPVVDSGTNTVYVNSSSKNELIAINATTGNVKWTTPNGAGGLGSPAVANGVVYYGSGDGWLYALNGSTGAILWSYISTGSISSVAVVAGVVYFVTSADSSQGNVFAVDASNGHLIWKSATGVHSTVSNSSPAIANGILYIGASDQKLYAFTLSSGALLWSSLTDSTFSGAPAVANGIVYDASQDGNLYAFDASKGAKLFAFKTGSSPSSPIVSNGIVYVISGSTLYALHEGIAVMPTPTSTNAPSTPTATPPPTPSATPTPVITEYDDQYTGTAITLTYAGSGWVHHVYASGSGYYDDTLSYTNTLNDSLTVTFTGTQIQIIDEKDSNLGYVDISIDGGTQTQADEYNPSKIFQQVVYTSPALAAGSHTLTLTCPVTPDSNSGGGSGNAYCEIDAIIISS